MNKGFIKLYRKFTDWEWYDDINTCRVFIHLLIKANYKDKKWRGIDIKRGQYLTSRNNLIQETGLTEQQIKTSLKRLKSTNEITSQSTNNYTIISITNYDLYQETNQPDNQQLTSEQPATNQQLTTTKESNNIKKEKKEKNKDISENSKKEFSDEFILFWNKYPAKRGSKKKSQEQYKLARKKTDGDTILNGLENYKKYLIETNTDEKYIKHCERWIRDEGYNDDYVIPEKLNETQKIMKELGII